MNPAQLLEHFDRISEAPDAVARLRRFILDLAVRGKLVEQDPSDEPAAELLKRIQAEKALLLKEGKIKESKVLNQITATAPYNLPTTWQWVPLGVAVNSHLGGGTPSKNNSTYWDGDIYWASVKDIGKGKYVDETIDRITRAGLADSSSNLIPPGNLIVVTRMGLGKISINRIPIAINQDLRALSLSSLAAIDYYYNFFKTHGFEGSGLTVKGIKVEELLNIPFPIPPLAEQHRIVAKVDELMALCDQLEAAKNERETRRDRLVAASLHRIGTAPAAAGEAATEAQSITPLRDAARFHLDHLPRLTTRPEHIKQLRQTILNLAVRGRLVPQDPNDEPVNLSTSPDDLKSATLPKSWRYEHLANLLVEDTRNGYSRRPDEAPDGIPILRISAGTVRRDGIVAEEEHKLISGIDPATRTQYGLNPGDLLACRFNGNKAFVGRLTIFNDYLGIQPIYPDKLIRVRVAPALSVPAFLRLAGDTDLVRGNVEAACATTVGNWGISASNLKGIRFPVPPLPEQHRIVAKVDELMALCDQLEAQLTTTQTDSRRLLEAVLHESLAKVA